VGIAIVVLVMVLDLGRTVLHIGEVQPDAQIAYVGSTPLPEETVSALETALAALCEDANGDGAAIVRINQYILAPDNVDAAMYTAASAARLIVDMENCDSGLFLLEDGEAFQEDYAILARLDGTLPTGSETRFADCCLRWADCPVLAGLELGSYTAGIADETVTGDSQDLLSGLYIARRGFWTDKTVQYPEALDGLWAELTEGAAP